MLGRSKGWTALAGALVVCAALLGCGREPSIASQSAEAFREAQKKGDPVGDGGHGHVHGSSDHGSTATEHPAGHDHGAAEAPTGGGGHEGHGAHAGHEAKGTGGAGQHGGDHSAMDHGRSATSSRGGTPKGHEESSHSGHAGHSEQAGHSGGTEQAGHAGHGTAPPPAPGASVPPQAGDHAGHTGHSASAGGSPTAAAAPAPVSVAPEQPAKTLQPDSLDAPAATSVIDAQRSAEMAQGMAGGHGGHGGHGVGKYRHVDAGRGPEAYMEKDQPPGAGSGNESQQHDHGSTGHSGHGAQETAGLYVCPMHPDVTSDKPGTCPKCGMALVERRKE